MSSVVEQFRSRVDPESARKIFREMTETEEPIWLGSPSVLSMLGRYLLIATVFLTHVVFYWAAVGGDLDGEGRLNFAIGIAKLILDISGVFGFVVVMLIITKINHYLNFSTSGRWTTTWLAINSFIPFLVVIADWSGALLGIFMDDVPDTPRWSDFYYLLLGCVSCGTATILTISYQRAFTYAISNRRVHIRKQFMYVDTSLHGISFSDIENLIASPPIIGRLLGFGNLFMITASGMGLESNSIQIGAGSNPTPGPGKPTSALGKASSLLFGWISLQRARSEPLSDPENCLFGIRDPMEIYQLLNELMDSNVGPAGVITPESDSE